MIKPISVDQIQEIKNITIPDEVIAAFNEMIVNRWNGRSATFKLLDVVALALGKLKAAGKEASTFALFENHSFDVEEAYRREGWAVKFDRPGYNETYYDAYFVFSKPCK